MENESKTLDVLMELEGMYTDRSEGNMTRDLERREVMISKDKLQDFYDNWTLKDAFCHVAEIDKEKHETIRDCAKTYFANTCCIPEKRLEHTLHSILIYVNGKQIEDFNAEASDHLDQDQTISGRNYNVLSFEIIPSVYG